MPASPFPGFQELSVPIFPGRCSTAIAVLSAFRFVDILL
jgi:hypothetical protein